MKNRGWRNQRGLVRAGKRRRRKAKRAQESLRVVEPEAVEEDAEEEQDPQPGRNLIEFMEGMAGRKQKRRYELQKRI